MKGGLVIREEEEGMEWPDKREDVEWEGQCPCNRSQDLHFGTTDPDERIAGMGVGVKCPSNPRPAGRCDVLVRGPPGHPFCRLQQTRPRGRG